MICDTSAFRLNQLALHRLKYNRCTYKNSIPPLSLAAQIGMKIKARPSFILYNILRGQIPYKARGSKLKIVNSI